MSKGSRQRTGNTPQFNNNWDKIFGAKDDNSSVPRRQEEKCANNETVNRKGEDKTVCRN